ncbi:MAG: HesB/IscA family protein [Phototrophicaceae bacterium]
MSMIDNITIGIQEDVVTVTPLAAQTIYNLLQARGIPQYSLRVFVSGGGCSGLQYGMAFEETPRQNDYVTNVTDGVRVLVDSTSYMYLNGATIDFVDSLMGGGFRIDNPNAVSSCGCGHSFRTGSGEHASSEAGCSTCSTSSSY